MILLKCLIAGRKISKLGADGFTHWKYDSGNYAKGKLHEVAYYKGKTSASGTSTYLYMGLMAANDISIEGESFCSEYSFDAFNRVYYTRYPANNFAVKNTYTSLGYLSSFENATYGHREFGKVYEKITKMNYRGQVTEMEFANRSKETKKS